MAIDAWEKQGRYVEVLGQRVFVVERGDLSAPVLAILHGFPSWSADFALVLDALAAKFRVIVHDHLGFGLSNKPRDGYAYSLFEQAEVALALWVQLGVKRAHLLGHDYGTSVLTEVLARRERGGIPLEVASATFSNGSMHLELAHLRLSQKILRSPTFGPIYASLGTRGIFVRRLQAILRKPVDPAHLHDMFDAVSRNDGRALLPALSQYIGERERFQPRWIGAVMRAAIPVHVLWAEDDPVAVRAIGEKLASEIPGAVHTRLPGLGHYPMLEGPAAYAAAALAFWSRL